MFKRIKKLWQLTKKDPKALEILENLTDEQLKSVPEEGDEKAEFLGMGTEEEFVKQQRKDNGLQGWYERLKKL